MKLIRLSILPALLLSSCKKDPYIPSSAPIAHFTFNNSYTDQSPYHIDTGNWGAVLTRDSLGDENSAYYFNGKSYIELVDNNHLDIPTNNLSICAWINPARNDAMYIVEKTNIVYQGEITEGGGPFSLDIFPGRARAVIYGEDRKPLVLTGTTKISKNVWQHLAVAWDGKIARLYYNGKVEASAPFEIPIMVTNGNVYIGAYKFVFPGASFKGSIDNVRIYERCLSDGEINDLYLNYK